MAGASSAFEAVSPMYQVIKEEKAHGVSACARERRVFRRATTTIHQEPASSDRGVHSGRRRGRCARGIQRSKVLPGVRLTNLGSATPTIVEGQILQMDRLAHCGGIAAKRTLPVAVTENRHDRSGWCVVRRL